MVDNSLLVPKRSIFNLIGSLCKNPSLLIQEEFKLEAKDFYELFYQSVFMAINNIVLCNGEVKNITAVDIDNYLSMEENAYNIFVANEGLNYINSAIEHSNPQLFKQNFLWVKKFALLREFNVQGFNISELYNPHSETLKQQIDKLEKMELSDIIDFFSIKLINIENKWDYSKNCKSYQAKDGIKGLVKKLTETPSFGHPFPNKYYNAVFRGMQRNKLLIRSCVTGGGKTRLALADLVRIACSEIYNVDKREWVYNGESYPTSFISTELEIEELQTCLLAIVSGIPENIIKDGKYNQDNYNRLCKAVEIIENSPIYLYYIDDFNISDIEQIIKKDVIQKNVEYVFFDYLQITPKLSRSIQEEYKLGLREDQILHQFSARLKNLAKKYNIFIATATQLNRNSNDRTLRNASAISGGSAVINKCDFAMQTYDLNKNDLAEIATIIEKTQIEPNCVHVVYKNRGGMNHVNIYTILDKSNVREKVAFITTSNNELITNIVPIDIKFLT